LVASAAGRKHVVNSRAHAIGGVWHQMGVDPERESRVGVAEVFGSGSPFRTAAACSTVHGLMRGGTAHGGLTSEHGLRLILPSTTAACSAPLR
jgi:hypothetical protein